MLHITGKSERIYLAAFLLHVLDYRAYSNIFIHHAFPYFEIIVFNYDTVLKQFLFPFPVHEQWLGNGEASHQEACSMLRRYRQHVHGFVWRYQYREAL